MGRRKKGVRSDEILDLLGKLVERSMVSYDEANGRYTLLETIRQYAAEELVSSNEAKGIRDQHLDYFLDLSKSLTANWIGREQELWFRKAVAELENFRLALDYAYQSGRPDKAAQLLGSVMRSWEILGINEEADARAAEALSQADFLGLPQAQAEVLRHMAMAANRRDDHRQAEHFQRQAVKLAEESGDRILLATHQRGMGNTYLTSGQIDAAGPWYEKSKNTLGADADPMQLASIENNLGIVAFLQGRNDDAITAYRHSMILETEAGRAFGSLVSTTNLAKALITAGRLREGAETALKALESARRLQALGLRLEAFEAAAMLSVLEDPSEAAVLFGAIHEIRRQHRMPVLKFARYIESWQERAKAALPSKEYEALANQGSNLTLAETFDLAERRFRRTLEENDSSS